MFTVTAASSGRISPSVPRPPPIRSKAGPRGRGQSIWDTFAATPGNVKNADNGADRLRPLSPLAGRPRSGPRRGLRRLSLFLRLAAPDPRRNGRGESGRHRFLRPADRRHARARAQAVRRPSIIGTCRARCRTSGGWMNRDIAGWFADYAGLVASHFGDRLHATATINEPWCVSVLCHFSAFTRRAIATSAPPPAPCTTCFLRTARGRRACAPRASRTSASSPTSKRPSPRATSRRTSRRLRLGDALFNGWFLGGLYKGQYPEVLVRILEPYLPAGLAARTWRSSADRSTGPASTTTRARCYAADPTRATHAVHGRSRGRSKRTTSAGKSIPRA